jgi:hypothetical protein
VGEMALTRRETMIDDGGPAYPWTWWGQNSAGETVVRDGGSGMSLRDYFAGQALAGMCANPES